MENDKIKFHLPDYIGHFMMNRLFVMNLKEHPEWFYPDIEIGSIYGSFMGAIWNGGRVMVGGISNSVEIDYVYKVFNDYGVPLRHTFTNKLIKGNLVYDTYCNLIMQKGHNGLNEVLVNTDELEAYIRETYPKYPIISSTTKRIKSVEEVEKEAAKDYKLVVLDYSLNRNLDIFMLPDKERYEILINAYCCDDCPVRSLHYTEMAEDQLSFGSGAPGREPRSCQYIADDFYTAQENRKDTLKVEEVYGFYAENGFRNFKIEGRTTNMPDVLESYIYYMVKPEFKDRVRLKMLKGILMPDPALQPENGIREMLQMQQVNGSPNWGQPV